MKTFIVLMILAIGLFVSLPSTSSGSAPPGQSSFVNEYSQLAPAAVMVQEEGGYTIEKSLNTSLAVGYSNKDMIVNAPDFTRQPDYYRQTYLTCRSMESQNLLAQNIESRTRCTIRADSRI